MNESHSDQANQASLNTSQVISNPPASINGQPAPHPVQAPPQARVSYTDLENHVGRERTVREGVRSVISGIQSRIEEIAGDKSKDADALRAELTQLASELNGKADGLSGKVLEGTASADERDPNSNPPAKPQLNV